MSKSIEPGHYTIRYLLDQAGFNLKEQAGADYLNGEPDHRRVTVGGLPISDLEEAIVIPWNATEVDIALDGKSAVKLEVDNGVPKTPQESTSDEPQNDPQQSSFVQ